MRFAFGQNWSEFSSRALTAERVDQARRDFLRLVDGIELRGRQFLDIGFGQGLGLLTAAAAGARVVGCDIDSQCGEVLVRNQARFVELGGRKLDLEIGSILDPDVVERLRARTDDGRGFDLVHAWGVLHHTGNMRQALANAASLVGPGGWLVVAIYNRHWSSAAWQVIKWGYCRAPGWLRRALVAVMVPLIWVAKRIVTGTNPQAKERGMDFYYDVVDWVGGYPYEYATVDEVRSIVEPLGLACVRVNPAGVPTGCNEIVFRMRPSP